jgi:hypothetical protein
MIQRPELLNLANWRQSPYSQWSFHHVREVIPTEAITADPGASLDWPVARHGLEQITFDGVNGETWSLNQLHQSTHSDALLVAHQGKLVHEWYSHEDIGKKPHIVFSVSKSMTATLAEF